MMFSSAYQGHTNYRQMAVRQLTWCQYCQLRTWLSQSIVKSPSHKLSQSKDQICFHHSAASNGTMVIWDKRCFLNHKFFTYMPAFHSEDLKYRVPISNAMQSALLNWQTAQRWSPNKYKHTHTQSTRVWLCCPGKWVFGSKLGNYRDHSNWCRLGILCVSNC